ncbi:MAG: peptidyl-prolyl cis-trans isomerase [Nitrospirae bacterium]|nr:peptidyl-prolyl cis-trans isomerase [Nitrospirota bacterium]
MNRPSFWLWVGILGGLALTLGSILRPKSFSAVRGSNASGDSVAEVNGRSISKVEFDRMLGSITEKDSNIRLTRERQREILDQWISEELLLQRAVEMGMAQKDPVARRLLVRSMIDSIGSGEETNPPDESELKSFFEKRRQLFARDGRLRVEHIFIRAGNGEDGGAQERAEATAEAWRNGKSWSEVRRVWGDDPLVRLPEGFLTAEKLREYLGPTAARTAMETEAGKIGGPVRAVGGYHLLKVVSKEPLSVPAFEEVRDGVRRAFQEERKAKQVQSYIKNLRAQADIKIHLESE